MRQSKPLSYLLLTIVICSLLSCNDERVPETFLIDKNFRGFFHIVYNQEDGQKKKFEGESRLYVIPKAGVLFTQFEPDWRGMTYHNGRTRQRFYFVDYYAERIEIPVYDMFDFNEVATVKPKNEIYSRDSLSAFFISAGTIANEQISLTTQEYFIGTYNEIVKTKPMTMSYIDSLRVVKTKNGM